MLVEFSIRGSLRFLSHAETLRLFQRACVRAGLSLQYGRGYNPRPKLSLPFPRTVGVESHGDLLCVRIIPEDTDPKAAVDIEGLRADLSSQLPEGCDLSGLRAAEGKASVRPSGAVYTVPVARRHLDKELKARIEQILASDSIVVRRRTDARGTRRDVDVRPFLESIEVDDAAISVTCKISPEGAIRVEEILKLVELDYEMLGGAIRRTSVRWLRN